MRIGASERSIAARLRDREVRDADVPHCPLLDEFVHRVEGLLVGGLLVGRVNQEEIDVLGVEPIEAVAGRLDHRVVGAVLARQFRRDEHLFAVDVGIPDRIADRRFALVHLCGVDVAIARVERGRNGPVSLVVGVHPRRAEAECGHRRAIHGDLLHIEGVFAVRLQDSGAGDGLLAPLPR